MAIAGLSVKTGSKGYAVAHANYVAREGQYARYTERGEILEATGSGNLPDWATHDASLFWQASDAYERANGTAYREFVISLPRELSTEQRIDLVNTFVGSEIGEQHAYQYAIHVPKASDGLENPHVHLMFSERRIDGIDRNPEQYFKRYNAANPERGGAQKGYGENPGMKLTRAARVEELKALRMRWEGMVNGALENAGIDVRVNMKSYIDRGLDIEPEPKQLPSAWRGEGRASVLAFREQRAADLAERIEPDVIIEQVSSMKAVFTRQDLYRNLSTVTDDPVLFNQVKAQLDVHPLLVALETGRAAGSSQELLTTQRVIAQEQSVKALGEQLVKPMQRFEVSDKSLSKALLREPRLSDEQKGAVKHLSGSARLAMVAGVAGAGKSTMLSVVREGYEAAGFRVSGMALAGKAADELFHSSGINSRTIASWLYRESTGEIQLSKKDVVVIDEAGMVHNGTMSRVLDAVERAGAKAILVGDSEQLQPIQAGCPFRMLSDTHGVSEITVVRRQNASWQREATQALSRGEGRAALAAYEEQGCVHRGEAQALVPSLVKEYLDGGDGDLSNAVILAHRKVDVAMLNEVIRSERIARGALKDSVEVAPGLILGCGDRVVFTKNDASLGVLNGQFGEVTGFKDRELQVRLDAGHTVSFNPKAYAELSHGYASTIHKSQGMTVDRAMVWGSASLDRHLGYVAMSRHRASLSVYQPAEATRVRSLAHCLSRSTREVSVDALMQSKGLGLTQTDDGQVKLSKRFAQASDVESARARVEQVRTEQQEVIQGERERLWQAYKQAEAALKADRQQEPSSEGLQGLRPLYKQEMQVWRENNTALQKEVYWAERTFNEWQKTHGTQQDEPALIESKVKEIAADAVAVLALEKARVSHHEALQKMALAASRRHGLDVDLLAGRQSGSSGLWADVVMGIEKAKELLAGTQKTLAAEYKESRSATTALNDQYGEAYRAFEAHENTERPESFWVSGFASQRAWDEKWNDLSEQKERAEHALAAKAKENALNTSLVRDEGDREALARDAHPEAHALIKHYDAALDIQKLRDKAHRLEQSISVVEQKSETSSSLKRLYGDLKSVYQRLSNADEQWVNKKEKSQFSLSKKVMDLKHKQAKALERGRERGGMEM